MRGLTREERNILCSVMADSPDTISDAEEAVCAELVTRGLLVASEHSEYTHSDDEFDWFDYWTEWDITADGRLALRVCTVTP